MSSTTGSTRRLILLFGAALLILAGVAESLDARGPLASIYPVYFFPAVAALYVITGVTAWWRRPANRLGELMTAAGAATIATGFANSGLAEFVALGAFISGLPLAIFIHIVHAAPTGVVRGRAQRVTVAAGYVVFLVVQIPIWAFTPEGPPFDTVTISPRPDLADLGHHVQQGGVGLVVIATLWLVGRRLRTYANADRRLLAGLLGVALLAVITAAGGKQVLPSFGLDVIDVANVQIAAAALVPFGFLLVVLRGGFLRSDEVDAFTRIVAVPAGTVDARLELDRAVVAALGDPSAVLLRWTDGGYVDATGEPAKADDLGPHRAVFAIIGHEAPLGAVVYDALLGTDPAGLGAVATVVGVTLERERLAGEVSESRAALQEASRRVLVASDLERRRVTRDLHDGLQGPLVLLSMQARELARDAAADVGRATTLADGLDLAARTLRSLVDGVLPAPLIERGLFAAMRNLADNLPLDATVEVDLPEGVLQAPVESTAYFIVAEAVTNIVKHAQATHVWMSARCHGDRLVIDVVDDGIGGGDYTGGTGLRGLHDRVAILGGTMQVTRPDTGTGTRIVATLPCG